MITIVNVTYRINSFEGCKTGSSKPFMPVLIHDQVLLVIAQLHATCTMKAQTEILVK